MRGVFFMAVKTKKKGKIALIVLGSIVGEIGRAHV